MKHIKNWILGGLLVVILATTASADLQKGIDAYNAEDYATALAEFTPLAEVGLVTAQYYLGRMYQNGEGVLRNYAEAIKWYRRAAEAGGASPQTLSAYLFRPRAQSELGRMYANGKGVLQDYVAAARWYRLAAEAGIAEAQNRLGGMYERGEGVPQDYRLSYMWFNLAAAQGYEDARKNRDFAARRMTPEQIAEAQEMSSQCLANNYKNCK